MNRKRLYKAIKKLDQLYGSIPVTLECKGLCQESCGPIGMTGPEFIRISGLSGIVPKVDNHLTCNLLKGGKCSVYDVRPMICRLWGMVQSMECPHGCVPTPRYLTREEGFEFLRNADKVSGSTENILTIEGPNESKLKYRF